jgi:hypothetical protein
MLRKLLLSGLAVIGLLAGPQKASAQTVFACVSSAANSPIIIRPTADAPCPPSAGGVTWTKVTLSQTPGPIASSEFSCGALPTLTSGGPLFGSNGTYFAGVTFGSGITYTPMATTFVLQPGIYLLQLNAFNVSVSATAGTATFLRVNVQLNGSGIFYSFFQRSQLVNGVAFFPVPGNKLLQISDANTTVGFTVVFSANNTSTFLNDCEIIFTRLQ